MSEVKFADLKKAAKELNIVLKPDVPIKTVGVKADYLIGQIKEGASLLDPAEGDVIHRTTADVITSLGCVIPDGVKIKEEDSAAEPAKEEAAPASVEAEGKAPGGKSKKSKKNATAAAKKGSTWKEGLAKSKYTRSQALVDALSGDGDTKTGMAERANRLYVDNGGTNNAVVARSLLDYVMPSLLILGIVKETKKGVYQKI